MNSEIQCATMPPVRILVAEDEPEIRDYLQLALRRPNFTTDFVENGEEVLNFFASGKDTPTLLILDVMMPCKDGISTLREIRRTHPSLPIIMLSGLSLTANIVEAMKSGANNFLTKPISHEALRQAVDQLLPSVSIKAKIPAPATCRAGDADSQASNWNKKLEPLLQRISKSEVPILLQGETGSGKEVLARRVHHQSSRSGEIFLKLNCAALPSELVESELFGYERGAFTGAFKSNPGKFELANGGTILLDEIGDMDLKLQAKLLQVLQDHEFLRLGAKDPTRVDVRVIAATHRDLEALIADGGFREDLYYRLNVVNIVIPPLRQRPDEIIPLALSFLKKHNHSDGPLPQIGPELKSALLDHRWPGNVRELENVMRRYLVIRDADMITEELRAKAARVSHFEPRLMPDKTTQLAAASSSPPESYADQRACPASAKSAAAPHANQAGNSELAKVDQARKQAETDVIIQALNSTLWNRKRAATLLGTDYKAMLYKMKKLGIG